MEGGVAIILLLLIVVVAAAFALGFTSLGGALSLRRRTDSRQEAEDEETDRPVHTEPTTPYHEHTRFVGSDRAVERSEQLHARGGDS
jgi:hypothetical protein